MRARNIRGNKYNAMVLNLVSIILCAENHFSDKLNNEQCEIFLLVIKKVN